jgi:hypothetical protein
MKELKVAEQEKLIEFARFFTSYNPEYRMADGMKAQFLKLRIEVEKIVDRMYHVE